MVIASIRTIDHTYVQRLATGLGLYAYVTRVIGDISFGDYSGVMG